jgi:phytoene/squalene synthetase
MLLLPLSGERGTAGAIGSMVRIAGHDETNRIRARVIGQALQSIRFLPDRRSGALRIGFPGASTDLAAFGMPRRYGHLTVVPGGK